MIVATLLAWLGFFIIINSFDPNEGNAVIFVMFYGVLFLAALGTLSLLGFWSRSLWNRRRGIPRLMVTESFRQAVIFSGVLMIALWLQASRILTWWNIIILVILGAVVEFFILVFYQSPEKKLEK